MVNSIFNFCDIFLLNFSSVIFFYSNNMSSITLLESSILEFILESSWPGMSTDRAQRLVPVKEVQLQWRSVAHRQCSLHPLKYRILGITDHHHHLRGQWQCCRHLWCECHGASRGGALTSRSISVPKCDKCGPCLLDYCAGYRGLCGHSRDRDPWLNSCGWWTVCVQHRWIWQWTLSYRDGSVCPEVLISSSV